MCDIKETALVRKSENPTLSMEQIQPNSEHSSFNSDLVSMIVPAFANDRSKVNFAISYLKDIALAHFENSLIEPDLLNPPDWEDDYGEFILELKTYFESPDIVGEAESKLENLSMKPNQRIAKYLIEFNHLATITRWNNRTLRHQFYCRLPARIKDEVSRVGKPITLPELQALAQSIDGRYWEREEETRRECGGQSSEKKTDKPQSQPSLDRKSVV